MDRIPTFADVLEDADKLPLDDQEALASVLHKRVIERRRQELARETREAEKEYRTARGRSAMSNESVTLTIPDSLARELDTVGEQLLIDILERGLREYKIDQVLDHYARGGVSFAAAARQAGVSRSELARHAYARGMKPTYSAETLAEELGQSG